MVSSSILSNYNFQRCQGEMGIRAVRGYFCTADCASPNAYLKCVWGFFLSFLPSCNQGCCLQVVLAAKPCFDLARDHSQTCQECSCSCSLHQSKGSTVVTTAQLRVTTAAPTESQLSAPSPLLCWWLSVAPIMSLPSPPISNPTTSPAQFPKGNAQADVSEFPC